jgi:hypothetical protein
MGDAVWGSVLQLDCSAHRPPAAAPATGITAGVVEVVAPADGLPGLLGLPVLLVVGSASAVEAPGGASDGCARSSSPPPPPPLHPTAATARSAAVAARAERRRPEDRAEVVLDMGALLCAGGTVAPTDVPLGGSVDVRR